MTPEIRDLLVRADSLCSLIYYREKHGLSEITKEELPTLIVDIRAALKEGTT